MLSKSQIKEFKKIYRKQFDISISDMEAKEKGERLVELLYEIHTTKNLNSSNNKS